MQKIKINQNVNIFIALIIIFKKFKDNSFLNKNTQEIGQNINLYKFAMITLSKK